MLLKTIFTKMIIFCLQGCCFKNKIKRVGPDKGGHWEIVEK